MLQSFDNAPLAVDHIANELYNSIDKQLHEVERKERELLLNAHHLRDLYFTLKSEFHSLSTYERKLVFPAMLNLFSNQKNTSAVNVYELQLLTQRKEKYIQELVDEIEGELSETSVYSGELNKLLLIFKERFLMHKNKWHAMLNDFQMKSGTICKHLIHK